MSYNKLKNGEAAIYVRTDNGRSYTRPETKITVVEVVDTDHRRTGRNLNIEFRRDQYGDLHVEMHDEANAMVLQPPHVRISYNGIPLKF